MNKVIFVILFIAIFSLNIINKVIELIKYKTAKFVDVTVIEYLGRKDHNRGIKWYIYKVKYYIDGNCHVDELLSSKYLYMNSCVSVRYNKNKYDHISLLPYITNGILVCGVVFYIVMIILAFFIFKYL